MPDLFTPIRIGSIEAKNRVFMAPLTRARATREGVPTDLMTIYYGQRASAGLIITEATGISRVGLGWPYAPGIWNDAQVEKWKLVTQEVHEKGGKIINQLWHMGRAVHSNDTGSSPVSSSATSYPGEIYTFDGKKPSEVAHVLTQEEIDATVRDYAEAAKNAMRAGFDGVEIHAGNGYLIDQFLRDGANKRTDKYGGSIENRVRFLDEVVAAVTQAVGPEQTSVRFSPNGDSLGVIDSDPIPLYTKAAEVLEKHHVAMVELRETTPASTFWGATDQPKVHDQVREKFSGVIVLNQEYTREEAIRDVGDGTADAITFGRKFIANPNLPKKLKNNEPIAVFDDMKKWWYSQGPEGYIDFPAN